MHILFLTETAFMLHMALCVALYSGKKATALIVLPGYKNLYSPKSEVQSLRLPIFLLLG